MDLLIGLFLSVDHVLINQSRVSHPYRRKGVYVQLSWEKSFSRFWEDSRYNNSDAFGLVTISLL